MNLQPSSPQRLPKIAAAGAPACIEETKAIGDPGEGRTHVLGAVTGAIKNQLKDDWLGTLKRVANIGFRELEFSEPLGPSDAELRKALDDLELRAIAGGTGLYDLRLRLPAIIDQWQAQGKKFLACYWPWLDGGENKTLDDYRALSEMLNDLGRKSQTGGLRFVFHHHHIEFIKTEERIPLELLLAETDPDLVSMELDTYWLAKAAADPVYYLETYPRRFPIVHLCDMSQSGDKSIVCPGEGVLDFRPTLAAAVEAGVDHVLVENPSATTGLDCLQVAYTHVRGLPF